MKDNKTLEEVFKSRLSEREVPATPQLWERISASLPEQKDNVRKLNFLERNKYLLAASISGLLLTIGAFLFYFNNKSENIISENKTIQTTPDTNNYNSTNSNITSPVETHTTVTKNEQKVNKNISPTPKNNIKNNALPITENIVESMVAVETKDHKTEVLLPDSSKVYLNRNSVLTYSKNYNVDDRTVNLSGEAFFDVRKSNGKKFTIHCNNSTTIVLGTSFNLISRKGDLKDEVEVVTGRVQFSSKETSQNAPLILTKGMKGIVDENKLSQTTMDDPNFMSWQTEKLVFSKTKMDKVIPTLEKYFNIHISVKDSNIMNLTYNGSFEKPELKNVLDVVSTTLQLAVETQGNEYILKAKSKK